MSLRQTPARTNLERAWCMLVLCEKADGQDTTYMPTHPDNTKMTGRVAQDVLRCCVDSPQEMPQADHSPTCGKQTLRQVKSWSTPKRFCRACAHVGVDSRETKKRESRSKRPLPCGRLERRHRPAPLQPSGVSKGAWRNTKLPEKTEQWNASRRRSLTRRPPPKQLGLGAPGPDVREPAKAGGFNKRVLRSPAASANTASASAAEPPRTNDRCWHRPQGRHSAPPGASGPGSHPTYPVYRACHTGGDGVAAPSVSKLGSRSQPNSTVPFLPSLFGGAFAVHHYACHAGHNTPAVLVVSALMCQAALPLRSTGRMPA